MPDWDGLSFLMGSVAGAIVAFLFGLLLGRVQLARGMSQAHNRNMWVGHSTSETPAQVIRRSIRAFFQFLFWGALLLVFVGVVVLGVIGVVNTF